jgi:supervillin
MEICIVKDFKRTPVQPTHFLSSECYVCMYTTPQQARVFYYWIGANTSQTQQGGASSLAKEWLDTLGRGGNLLRVEQGKEPPTFLYAFGGKFIVLLRDAGATVSATRMIHIRGAGPTTTRSIECTTRSGVYLNSDDCFIVSDTSKRHFLWMGSHATPFCIASSKLVVQRVISPDTPVIELEEGAESTEFWAALSSNGPCLYAKHRDVTIAPRYFVCINVNKSLSALLQEHCVQHELISHKHSAILDLGNVIYVWFGCETSLDDKMIITELCVDLVSKTQRGECPVWLIDEGEEVMEFTRFFQVMMLGFRNVNFKLISNLQAWDPSLLKSSKKNVVIGDPLAISAAPPLLSSNEILSKKGRKFALAALLDKDFLPEGVDPKKLELFLREEDFPSVFKCTHEEYFALPGWKQTELKKTSVLF